VSKPVLSDYKDFEIPIVQFYGFLKTHFVHFIGYSLKRRPRCNAVLKKAVALQQVFGLHFGRWCIDIKNTE